MSVESWGANVSREKKGRHGETSGRLPEKSLPDQVLAEQEVISQGRLGRLFSLLDDVRTRTHAHAHEGATEKPPKSPKSTLGSVTARDNRACAGETSEAAKPKSPKSTLAPLGVRLQFCRCGDCPLWSEGSCDHGIRLRFESPKAWHYCLDYAGPRLSNEVFWWR